MPEPETIQPSVGRRPALSFFTLGILLASSLGGIGCFGSAQRIAVVEPDRFRISELKRDDYSVLGDAKARHCRALIALWPLPIWFHIVPEFSLYGWIYNAEGEAWQRALESQPDADAVLLPRVTKEEVYVFWYHRVCYDVRAKAIRLILDSERPKAKLHVTPPP